MRAKRAHMVSRAYLKQWADKGGNVEVIDVQDRRGFTTDVVNATVVSYAYRTFSSATLNVSLQSESD